jgi:PAP2 superfamily
MRRTLLATFVAVLGAGLAGLVAPVAGAHGPPNQPPAKPLLTWSVYGEQAIVAEAPLESPVLLGILHVAMYDTAIALGLRGEPFADREQAPRNSSAEAAIAAVAYHVLVARTPGQREFLDATYEQYLAGIPDGPAKENGLDVGARVAERVLAWRDDDGLGDSVPYVQRPPGPGVWEPTEPTPPVGLGLTEVRPLTLRSIDQVRPTGPDRLTSDRYADDIDEVQRLGRVDSTERTAHQTETVSFWSENAALQWNRATHRIIAERRMRLGEAAKLLAAVHVSVGDATLACFDAKYHYRFWRPVHAIARADTDGNPATRPDRTWQSLLRAPNHPEYPSANACLTSAASTALRLYFHRDRLRFTMDSSVTGTTRRYSSLRSAVEEASNARIWSGQHLRHSMREGAQIGQRVACWATRNHFDAHLQIRRAPCG